MKQITFYVSLVLFFTVLNVRAQTVNILTKEAFRNPPKQYYPIPLWHMNGDLTDEGVIQQMTDAILKAWDPHSGKIIKTTKTLTYDSNKQVFTSIKLRLSPVSSIFYLSE